MSYESLQIVCCLWWAGAVFSIEVCDIFKLSKVEEVGDVSFMFSFMQQIYWLGIEIALYVGMVPP